MITQELKDAVKAEADLLKQHATKEELAKLEFETLNCSSSEACIYGQMTGNCWSKRASSLINSCATPYSASLNEYAEPVSDGFKFTAIEFYISVAGAQNANLIAYLKGETDTLEL